VKTLEHLLVGFAAEWRKIERERRAKLRAAVRAGNHGLAGVYIEAIDYARRSRANHLRTALECRPTIAA
jgi:hypothetical protein